LARGGRVDSRELQPIDGLEILIEGSDRIEAHAIEQVARRVGLAHRHTPLAIARRSRATRHERVRVGVRSKRAERSFIRSVPGSSLGAEGEGDARAVSIRRDANIPATAPSVRCT